MNETQETNETQEMNEERFDELNSLSKEELIKLVITLESKRPQSKRKKQVLQMLQTKPMTILEMSEALEITNKNISSQLTYLKKDGHKIATNSKGEKFIEDFDYSDNE